MMPLMHILVKVRHRSVPPWGLISLVRAFSNVTSNSLDPIRNHGKYLCTFSAANSSSDARTIVADSAAAQNPHHPVIAKLLVANRGEIACRVLATARKLGIPTVAVFSEADRSAVHTRMADEAVHIGSGSAASDTYLRPDEIIRAAKMTHATAIHPGYGFLSESDTLSELCANNGIAFVGPPSSAILAMGDKNESKRMMEAANVPVVPGYHGEDQNMKRLIREGNKVGFPLIVKAARGGGGKGMKLARQASELKEALESAKREAQAAFGDQRVLMERYIERPRHIEVQIIADSHGNIIHAYERDCSVQRRHQKVLEEAPAPNISSSFRESICDAAIAAARAVGYVSAGTVEFIVDTDTGDFFFMEMNTRLQVEHPISESITGIDLVEWQLRVAAGETLPSLQLPVKGHAFEARVYAESPEKDFMPAVGTVRRWQVPLGSSAFEFNTSGVRVDCGIQNGDEIGSFYDPMIAKVITQGVDRKSALRKMSVALSQLQVGGLRTNLAFLQRLVAHPSFIAADLDTTFISKHHDDLLGPQHLPSDVAALAVALTHQLVIERVRKEQVSLPGGTWGCLDSRRFGYEHVVRSQMSHPLSATQILGTTTFRRDGSLRIQGTTMQNSGESVIDVTIEGLRMEGSTFHADVGGVLLNGNFISYEVQDDCVLELWLAGVSHEFRQQGVRAWARGGQAPVAEGQVVSPMPGRVTKVFAENGEFVEEGAGVLALESMKMEFLVRAQVAGVVSGLSVLPGDHVREGLTLFEVTPRAGVVADAKEVEL